MKQAITDKHASVTCLDWLLLYHFTVFLYNHVSVKLGTHAKS